jgi:hypothetical protein
LMKDRTDKGEARNSFPSSLQAGYLESDGFWIKVCGMLVKSRIYIAVGFVCMAPGVI